MYEYIKGEIIETGPTHLIIETQGIAYHLHCSVQTAQNAADKTKIFIHLLVKEDDMRLYGFADKDEREIFRQLISVSGIGPNTAIIMLSSLTPSEIKHAIETENIEIIKTIKGIGNKTAQRIIIELKDKMQKLQIDAGKTNIINNNAADEAISALQMLGFNKKTTEKILKKIFSETPNLTPEDAVKKALKLL